MTPYEFLQKWRGVELKERSASQSHFNDLCRLLGVDDPVLADPKGEWFTFEKGATKTSGGEGWADVWRRNCFAWEYKGPRKNLDAAFAQLLQYRIALENPPLLIVSDMDRIIVHTNWTNTVEEKHEFTLEKLVDAEDRDRLKRAFTNPHSFKPTKTRQVLTEETAREFAGLAQRLRDRGHDAGQVAHFVNRLIFCMFAEDVGLLPDNIFTKMLEVSRRNPADFVDNAGALFRAMAHRNGKVGFTQIDWFNGGLFEDDHVLPIESDDIEQLLRAARRDWSVIDPAIMGTLFERGLDPGKRSQLGAHYTDRDKIMMIVNPVIVEPLEAEWADALARMAALIDSAPKRTADRLLSQAERRKANKLRVEATALHTAFIERLAAFRVLDPACGSGNFLYLALRALKDIEHRANLDAEALGLPRGFPRVGPENVLGIEINPYAAELARVSVWIGEIQWMRRNGFDASRNPILRSLETIECRDAVLNANGSPTDWPAADAIIGNPPFLGGKRLRDVLGNEYVNALFKAYADRVPQEADLVTYWVSKSWDAVRSANTHKVGLVTTNSIRGGANRKTLAPIADAGGLFSAWADMSWTIDGAAVRVSLIIFDDGSAGKHRPSTLDGMPVERINADLTSTATDLTKAVRLAENADIAFMGDTKGGAFDVPGNLARQWLAMPLNPNGRPNADVLKPWVNGMDVTRRPADKWIIDFGWTMDEQEAALYEAPFDHARLYVHPEREKNRREAYAKNWWRHVEPRQGMWTKLEKVARFIVTPTVAKHRLFAWETRSTCPDHQLIAIARDDDTTFGILHSRFHELWSLRMGTFLGVGNDPRYTPSTTFETFPFPEGLTPNMSAADYYADDPRAKAIASAAARLNELRKSWLNPADLVVSVPEVVPGYPNRFLPKDEEAAGELKKRTLTNLYNAPPAWLTNAHASLDTTVAAAYGWERQWSAGMADNDILAKLFELNQLRSGRKGGHNGEDEN